VVAAVVAFGSQVVVVVGVLLSPTEYFHLDRMQLQLDPVDKVA